MYKLYYQFPNTLVWRLHALCAKTESFICIISGIPVNQVHLANLSDGRWQRRRILYTMKIMALPSLVELRKSRISIFLLAPCLRQKDCIMPCIPDLIGNTQSREKTRRC